MGKGNFEKYLHFAPYNKRDQIIAKKPNREIEKFYAAADLFILPSIYEPFGNANLEALATGIPVITTKYCGAANIIDEKINGLIIDDPFNPQEIAKNINFLFDPSLGIMHRYDLCHLFIEGASYGIITDQEITGEYLLSAYAKI